MENSIRNMIRHSGESRNPGFKPFLKNRFTNWIPAFAGMTMVFVSPYLFAADPHAFPVPFTPARNPTHTKISFTDLPGNGSVKVFTIDGRLVIELPIPSGQSLLDWAVTNSDGKKVATGIYIYRVEGNGVSSQGKLVIIR